MNAWVVYHANGKPIGVSVDSEDDAWSRSGDYASKANREWLKSVGYTCRQVVITEVKSKRKGKK